MSNRTRAPEQSHFQNIAETADAVLGGDDGRNYEQELAQFKLMELRLRASTDPGVGASAGQAQVHKVLGKISEEEAVLYEVLGKINTFSESSPEYAQLMRLTEKKSRLDIATVIAKQVWDKRSRAEMFAPFVPTKEEYVSVVGGARGLLGGAIAALRDAIAPGS